MANNLNFGLNGDPAAHFEHLQNAVAQEGVFYAYPENHRSLQSPSGRNALQSLPAQTDKEVLVPISLGFPHVTLNFETVSIMESISRATSSLFKTQNRLIDEEFVQSALLGSDECAFEISRFGLEQLKAFAPLWSRLDFTIHRITGHPYLVDVNYFPGGIVFSQVLRECYESYFGKPAGTGYSIDPIIQSAKSYGLKNADEPKRALAVFAPFRHRFLSMEARRLGEYIQQTSEGAVLSADSHMSIRGGRFTHYATEQADDAVESTLLMEMAPPPCVWRESNFWLPFIWSEEFDRDFSDSHKETLSKHVPASKFVEFKDGRVWLSFSPLDADREPLLTEGLSGHVLKDISSAGGRGVTVVAPSSGKTLRERAWGKLMTDAARGNRLQTILQKFIKPKKAMSFGFSHNGHLGWVESPVRIAVYFLNDKALGGIATMTPSYKVQGGLLATNVPVYLAT